MSDNCYVECPDFYCEIIFARISASSIRRWRAHNMIARIVEDYRGCKLVVRGATVGFAGKAWRDDRGVGAATGRAADSVLQALKAQVDDLFVVEVEEGMIEYPPPERYKDALGTIVGGLPDSYLRMLRAHYDAPDRTITATSLAAAAGFKTWSSANLHYGTLGRMLGERIWFQPWSAASGPVWTMIIASAADRTANEGHWQWRMRPQVTFAIESLRVFVG
jgi:hypothetical protein